MCSKLSLIWRCVLLGSILCLILPVVVVSEAGGPTSHPNRTAANTTSVINHPPLAHAGPNRTVQVGDQIQLDGAGSTDVDGDRLTFDWTFVRIPSKSQTQLSDYRSVRPYFVIDQPGDYELELVVSDGLTESLPAKVFISTHNTPPTAEAGPDQTITVGKAVWLDGTASSDADGDRLEYEWQLTEVPEESTANLTDPTLPKSSFLVDQPGNYTAELTVHDSLSEGSSDSTRVSTDNSPPVADAGPDRVVQVEDVIQLDASGSTDVDGGNLHYRWALLVAPECSTAEISDHTALTPTLWIDSPGLYVAQLITNDGIHESLPDTIVLTTKEQPSLIACAGPGQTVEVGDKVQLDGSRSRSSKDSELEYQWSIVGSPIGSGASLSDHLVVNPTFTVDTQGEYVAQLMVRDRSGESRSDRVVISTDNSRPIAILGVEHTAAVGDKVLLDGSASHDVDDDVLSFHWSLLTAPEQSRAKLKKDNKPQARLVPDRSGKYVVQLIVEDGQEASQPVTRTLTVAELEDASITASTTDLELLGEAEDYLIISNFVLVDQQSVGQGVYNFIYQADVTNSAPAEALDVVATLDHVLPILTVIDGELQFGDVPAGATVTSQDTFTVQQGRKGGRKNFPADPDDFDWEIEANFRPVADAGEDQSATTGDLVQLDGSGSFDIEEQSLSYQWSLTLPPGSNASLSNSTLVDPTFVPDLAGSYSAQLIVNDGEVDSLPDTAIVTVTEGGNELPPDPVDVAPELDPTVATTLYDATEFLYTGDDPIQTGVDPGTIEPVRAAVLRGKVNGEDGNPLPGVAVKVLNHPEFGQTLSRTDGLFDMAVNGGGVLTLKYEKDGHLPAYRKIEAPWQDYVQFPEVRLIPRDTQVTPIDLTEPGMKVAQGSIVNDEDGVRQATLLFPEGVTAERVLEDGSTEPISNLSVRATEYTVGPDGPITMPAELPPTTAYTYAVELSVDEAIAKVAGKDIIFSEPVPFYVDNFIGFPVGQVVPIAYYDNDRAAWVPSSNGRVIEILGVTDGLADLDVDGSGLPADTTVLAELGITDIERTQLASLYQPGQSLWRSSLTHLSTYDCNWPYGPLPGDTANGEELTDEEEPDNECEEEGSSIACETQVLGELVPIVGSSFRLHYASDRVPGRKTGNRLRIPVSGDTVPDRLKRIELEIAVAGRTFFETFPAEPLHTYVFDWDGLDAYGRPIQGEQPVSARVGYVYDAVYQEPIELLSIFALLSGVPIEGLTTREEVILWQEQSATLGTWDARGVGLGGWTLNVHHRYDPTGRTLYKGDGTTSGASILDSNIITTIAGTGTAGTSSDGGPAAEAHLWYPHSVVLDAGGNLYISEVGTHRVRRVDTNGVISTVAGTAGLCGFSGDGGLATDALICRPTGLDIGPDGSLYIVDNKYHVRRVDTEGIISTVAGEADCTYGWGMLATETCFTWLEDVAVAPDNSFYLLNYYNHFISRVGTDGIVYPFFQDTDDYTSMHHMALSPSGDVYYTNQKYAEVIRIDPYGSSEAVAGIHGSDGFSGDGGLATSAELNGPLGITVSPSGGYYIADARNYRIRFVSPGRIITTLAGNGLGGNIGDNGPATAA